MKRLVEDSEASSVGVCSSVGGSTGCRRWRSPAGRRPAPGPPTRLPRARRSAPARAGTSSRCRSGRGTGPRGSAGAGAAPAGISLAGREQVAERGLPGLDDRVGRVGDVEAHGAVVGVDDGLDAVAHVVGVAWEAAVPGQLDLVADALGVRVAARRRVGVDDPQHPTVDDDGVRVAVVGQERRQLGQPVADVAHPQHLRVVLDRARAEHVVVEEGQGERGPADERRHLHAGRADVVLGLPAGAGPLGLPVLATAYPLRLGLKYSSGRVSSTGW